MMVSRLYAIWLKSSNQRKLMCHSRLHSPLFNIYGFTLQLAELSTFITGYEPRIQFAISLTAEQISRVQFQQAIIEEWFSSLKSKSRCAICEWQSYYNMQWIKTRVLRKGRSQEMSRSDDRKVQSKMRNWQSISRNHGKRSQKKGKTPGQPRELKHKKRRKGTTWMQAEAQD